VDRQELEMSLDRCAASLARLPIQGGGAYARVEATLDLLLALDRNLKNPDEDPVPVLGAATARAAAIAEAAHIRANDSAPAATAPTDASNKQSVADLYARAWTTYSESTYDHSVGLIEERLRRSGLDASFFRDKVCFDGGCGTGRFAVAMARAGARHVYAVDVAQQSLDYLRKVMERYRLTNIEPVCQDVTDLSAFATGKCDFVASNGVLHHTQAPERGIAEHFRITARGGQFWLYLYGAGGLYWDVYDRLRPVVTALDLHENYRILRELQVREGLIYTFLDNLRAPRVYYLVDEVLALLRKHGEFEVRNARGSAAVDDTEKLLASRWGRTVLGPQGEVRIIVTKS
jgi:ubiquinone/menaquinone biosynthesis C-methylase UbiE